MVILHIASINNDRASGVNCVVPQHVVGQAEYATVGLYNVKNDRVVGLANQLETIEPFSVSCLPPPFDAPDIVVFHEVFRPQYIHIYKELEKANIPYIIFPHGCLTKGALSEKWLKKKIAMALIFNRFIKHSRAIQCLSLFEQENTISVVPSFIGTNGFNVASGEVQKERNKKNIVYIGRIDIFHKGIDLLIKAASIVKAKLEEKGVAIHLYGPIESYTGRKINNCIKKMQLENTLFLHNAVFGDAKLQVLRSAGFFIQTSRYEGMPMGLLEAMSNGIPVIVTRGTSLSQFVDQYEAGYSAENDENSIAEALVKASECNDVLEKGLHAKQIIAENFSWEKVSRSNVNEYQRIIQGSQ